MEKESNNINEARNSNYGGAITEVGSQENVGLLSQVFSKNPLLHSAVIKCVLKFLNLKDIKNCRLVCREWKITANWHFINRSRIQFYNSESSINGFFGKPANYVDVFPNSPFRSFKISGRYPGWWSADELSQFFERVKNIDELDLDNVSIVNEEEMRGVKFDMTVWISGLSLTTAESKKTTKLIIKNCLPSSISVDALPNVKIIHLEKCYVNVVPGVKIRAVELKIRKVYFTRYGENLAEVIVNDFVDFSRMKILDLHVGGMGYYSGRKLTTSLILDLNEYPEIEIDEVSLRKVTLLNWTKTVWKINKLTTRGLTSLTKYSSMKVKEMRCFADYGEPDCIDLRLLPQSVENLILDRRLSYALDSRIYPERDQRSFVGSSSIYSEPIVLLNLKYLSLVEYDTLEYISNFVNCPLLTDIEVTVPSQFCATKRNINITWIPKTTKRLKFGKMTFDNLQGRNAINLDELIFENCLFTDIQKFCNSITIKNLVLKLRNQVKSKGTNDFTNFLSCQSQSWQRLYICGRLSSNDNELRRLAEFLDDETVLRFPKVLYHVIEHKQSKPITETEFMEHFNCQT